MSKKRVISIVLLVIMCAALLAGCKDYSNLAPGEPFSFLQKMEVNRVFREAMINSGEKDVPHRVVRWADDSPYADGITYMYFGVYNDAMVIYRGGSGHQTLTNVSIGGCYFTFPSSEMPLVIYNGQFYGFKDAYEKGVLTQAAVRQIQTYFGSEAYEEARKAVAMSEKERMDAIYELYKLYKKVHGDK